MQHTQYTIRALLMLSLLWLLNGCQPSASLQPLSPQATILAFGDSLTFGTGVSPQDSYPSVLQSLTGLKVINAGIPGEISQEGLARLPQLLAQHRPSLVILCHGGNDILQRRSKEDLQNNLRQMVQQITDAGSQTLLVSVTNIKLIPAPEPLYKALAKELNIPVENEIITYLETHSEYKSDRVHFNQPGYYKLAQAIEKLMRNSGALTQSN